jgi:hypothetical protein
MSRASATLAVLLVLGLALAGCGTKTVSRTTANGTVTTEKIPDVHFAKTKFVLHMGLAFGAFHRYIYDPYKSGAFKSGAPGRTKALLKAGAAAIYTVHELKTARDDALSDQHLRPLVEKLERLRIRLTSLGGSLKGGVLDAAGIAAAAGAVSSLGSESSGAGAVIKDLAPAI